MLFITLFAGALLLQLFFPWWIVAPLAYSVLLCYTCQSPFKSFILSFLAIYCLHCSYGLYLSLLNGHIMASRITKLLGLSLDPYNWLFVVLLTGLPGALIAGFSGLAGHYTRNISKYKRS